ncbi:chaperone activator [Kwoniella heveanensis CBS 569]|nr:chaperone activator [Kwoniella heveanensis CBS 569]
MGDPKPLTAYQQTYHWRNKNCAPFAYDWVKKSLPGLKVGDSSQSAVIAEVTSVSGDCDLGQRKGKLLTIYDLEVQAKWTGKAKDGSEVNGTLKVPEMSHEAIDGLSDYVFEWSLTSSPSRPSSDLLSYIKSSFPSVLSEKMNTFRADLLAAHGNPSSGDASPSPSGTSTPTASSSYAPAPPTKAPEPKKEEAPQEQKKDVGKTVTVEVKADLQASADDLWSLLTDENKIPMWSRSAAKISLSPDAPYELFSGNVRGKIVSVDAPKKLVQTWQVRNPAWPSDHYGTLTLSLNQGSDSTAATFTLDGVPVGVESDVEKALDTFYIRGLKQMGLVLSSSSRSYPTPLSRSQVPFKSSTATPSSKPKKLRRKTPSSSSSSSGWSTSSLLGGGVVVALSAVLVGIVYTSVTSPGSRA